MEKVVLKAEKRNVVGKQVRALRRTGKLPAVIYGHGIDPISIEMDARDAAKTLGMVSSSSLVTIELGGKQYPTLVREKQLDYIKNTMLHVDFLVVSMTEKITATVGIHLTGEAPAVKDFGAVMVTGLTEIEIECLPADLPERFTVDISDLMDIGSGIYVRDVAIPENVEVLTGLDELVVLATAPAVEEVEEEEEELLEGEEELEEPEVIEKGKKEEGDQEEEKDE